VFYEIYITVFIFQQFYLECRDLYKKMLKKPFHVMINLKTMLLSSLIFLFIILFRIICFYVFYTNYEYLHPFKN
jgi:hypothetical protein